MCNRLQSVFEEACRRGDIKQDGASCMKVKTAAPKTSTLKHWVALCPIET